METNNTRDDVVNNSTNSKDSDEDESFVTKVRSRVSGLLSSSFSRLFKNQDKQSGVVRPRSNEDEEVNDSQPPRKRAKGMENDILPKYLGENKRHSEFMSELNNDSGVESSIPGPSFISRREVQKTIANTSSAKVSNRGVCVDSDYTSGYSSMATVYNKQPIPGEKSMSSLGKPSESTFSERKSLFNISTPETPIRSLFADHTLSPQDKNTSLSSRRPSFNASNFGSPSLIDRTLTTSKIISSPFYSGSTIYGGASAYGKQLGINETRKQQMKHSFMVKPINKSSDAKSFTSLSKTARRILDTLEQCSTPLSDVKKVPLPTKTDKKGVFSKYVAANPYQKNAKVFSNKELLVPSVSEMLKMKQIQRLQATTNEIRQIAASSNSNLNNEEYKIATENQQKHTNKIKSKITSVRTKAPTIEIIDNYILNPVPLMIPEHKYPKFEIPELKLPVDNMNKNEDKTASEMKKPNASMKNSLIEKEPKIYNETSNIGKDCKAVEVGTDMDELHSNLEENQKKKLDFVTEYVFSKPLVIADNSKSIIAMNNFKFSEPLSKKIKLTEKASEIIQKKCKYNENKKMTNGNISCATDNLDLKKSSDPLLEKFKPAEGTWECQTCLIRNKSEASKCAACETPKIEKPLNFNKDSPASFGLQFSKKSDEWDCSTCLVRNKVQNNVCVACSTPKIVKPEINGIGSKQKVPSKEWECETCWVKNKIESVKCVACESIRKEPSSILDDWSKPISIVAKCQKCSNEIKGVGGKCPVCDKNTTNHLKSDFPSHLRPSSDTWECGTCLIRNKNDLKFCAACETPRDKSNNEITTGTIKNSDKWECPTCMVRNNCEVEKCPCCETPKPGITLVNKNNVNMFNFGVNKTQFTFGIPKDMQTSNSSTVSSTSSLFESNLSGTSNPVFKFGIVPESKDNDKTKKELPVFSAAKSAQSENKQEPNSIDFQPNNVDKDKTLNDTFQSKPPADESKTSLPVFKFGTSTSNSKESTKDISSTNPLFEFKSSKPVSVETDLMKQPSGDLKKIEKETTSLTAPLTSQNVSSKPLFSFGAKDSNSKDEIAKPMFNFGSSTVNQGGGFNFNPVKSDVKQQPAAGGFATDSQPLQSTNSGATVMNGGFNFGSTSMNSNQAAVFSFGATQNSNETAQLPKGGFDFSSAVKPTGGFNFTSPTPSFDIGSKPTFNFTGGSIPTFSANPTEGGGGPVPARKFKRALRRTQR